MLSTTPRPFNVSRQRSGRCSALAAVALVLLAASTVLGVSPVAADSDADESRTTVDFTVTGVRCQQEILGSTTLPDGTVVTRAVDVGTIDGTIGLVDGTLTVRWTTAIGEGGQGLIFGTWTLQPDASTGSLEGRLLGRISGSESVIRLAGSGRGALKGTTVKMVTTTPGPDDLPPCEDGSGDVGSAAGPSSFTGEGTASAPKPTSPIGAVTVTSTKDFTTTVDDLTATIEGNPNLTLVSTVDHQAAAASRELSLAPTTELFFGNPNIGTPLMQSSQSTGIDLPQKILVWEDLLGTVRVAYNAPAYLQSRHGITGADEQLQTVANALAGLTAAAAGTEPNPIVDAGTVPLGAGLVVVESDRSADDAFAAIVAALEAAPPVNVAFTLEHDANAARVGLELRPTKLVVFGNPSLGTGLMQTNQSAALDLPQKILVIEDEAGRTLIVYNDPVAVARRHGIEGQDDVLATLSGALANFANAGT